MFDFFFLALPGLMAAGGIAGMVWAIVRMRRLRAAWRSGIEVPGRCLRLYARTVTRRRGAHSSSSTALHHVYEFTTAEGEVRRFEEAGGSATVVEGDAVVVRYPAGRPERATALPPGDVRTRIGMVLLLGFLAVFVAACVGFGAFYLGVFKPAKEKVTERIEEIPRTTAPPRPAGPPDPANPGKGAPEGFPADMPTGPPDGFPTGVPSGFPTGFPTGVPSGFPSDFPSAFPSTFPSGFPGPAR
ncbi:hypothetical protein M1P56_28160 [Streptomyces sp. HU2014]|uniref:DUF3592 domain-containing protein n=1 Tax=Streptomyces sp. HU2014 TaxID=2939414 RepID=UPI00200E6311|nr:DUF3592 domain-containing protein [Streptomyces sp. HU2014]UQI47934.1 hypothetical protein M1P56_28160 [Streptomyces sp. HU2014]